MKPSLTSNRTVRSFMRARCWSQRAGLALAGLLLLGLLVAHVHRASHSLTQFDDRVSSPCSVCLFGETALGVQSIDLPWAPVDSTFERDIFATPDVAQRHRVRAHGSRAPPLVPTRRPAG